MVRLFAQTVALLLVVAGSTNATATDAGQNSAHVATESTNTTVVPSTTDSVKRITPEEIDQLKTKVTAHSAILLHQALQFLPGNGKRLVIQANIVMWNIMMTMRLAAKWPIFSSIQSVRQLSAISDAAQMQRATNFNQLVQGIFEDCQHLSQFEKVIVDQLDKYFKDSPKGALLTRKTDRLLKLLANLENKQLGVKIALSQLDAVIRNLQDFVLKTPYVQNMQDRLKTGRLFSPAERIRMNRELQGAGNVANQYAMAHEATMRVNGPIRNAVEAARDLNNFLEGLV